MMITWRHATTTKNGLLFPFPSQIWKDEGFGVLSLVWLHVFPLTLVPPPLKLALGDEAEISPSRTLKPPGFI